MVNKCEAAFFHYLLTADPATDPEYKDTIVTFLEAVTKHLDRIDCNVTTLNNKVEMLGHSLYKQTDMNILDICAKIDFLEQQIKEQELKIKHLQSYLNY